MSPYYYYRAENLANFLRINAQFHIKRFSSGTFHSRISCGLYGLDNRLDHRRHRMKATRPFRGSMNLIIRQVECQGAIKMLNPYSIDSAIDIHISV